MYVELSIICSVQLIPKYHIISDEMTLCPLILIGRLIWFLIRLIVIDRIENRPNREGVISAECSVWPNVRIFAYKFGKFCRTCLGFDQTLVPKKLFKLALVHRLVKGVSKSDVQSGKPKLRTVFPCFNRQDGIRWKFYYFHSKKILYFIIS